MSKIQADNYAQQYKPVMDPSVDKLKTLFSRSHALSLYKPCDNLDNKCNIIFFVRPNFIEIHYFSLRYKMRHPQATESHSNLDVLPVAL